MANSMYGQQWSYTSSTPGQGIPYPLRNRGPTSAVQPVPIVVGGARAGVIVGATGPTARLPTHHHHHQRHMTSASSSSSQSPSRLCYFNAKSSGQTAFSALPDGRIVRLNSDQLLFETCASKIQSFFRMGPAKRRARRRRNLLRMTEYYDPHQLWRMLWAVATIETFYRTTGRRFKEIRRVQRARLRAKTENRRKGRINAQHEAERRVVLNQETTLRSSLEKEFELLLENIKDIAMMEQQMIRNRPNRRSNPAPPMPPVQPKKQKAEATKDEDSEGRAELVERMQAHARALIEGYEERERIILGEMAMDSMKRAMQAVSKPHTSRESAAQGATSTTGRKRRHNTPATNMSVSPPPADMTAPSVAIRPTASPVDRTTTIPSARNYNDDANKRPRTDHSQSPENIFSPPKKDEAKIQSNDEAEWLRQRLRELEAKREQDLAEERSRLQSEFSAQLSMQSQMRSQEHERELSQLDEKHKANLEREINRGKELETALMDDRRQLSAREARERDLQQQLAQQQERIERLQQEMRMREAALISEQQRKEKQAIARERALLQTLETERRKERARLQQLQDGLRLSLLETAQEKRRIEDRERTLRALLQFEQSTTVQITSMGPMPYKKPQTQPQPAAKRASPSPEKPVETSKTAPQASSSYDESGANQSAANAQANDEHMRRRRQVAEARAKMNSESELAARRKRCSESHRRREEQIKQTLMATTKTSSSGLPDAQQIAREMLGTSPTDAPLMKQDKSSLADSSKSKMNIHEMVAILEGTYRKQLLTQEHSTSTFLNDQHSTLNELRTSSGGTTSDSKRAKQDACEALVRIAEHLQGAVALGLARTNALEKQLQREWEWQNEREMLLQSVETQCQHPGLGGGEKSEVQALMSEAATLRTSIVQSRENRLNQLHDEFTNLCLSINRHEETLEMLQSHRVDESGKDKDLKGFETGLLEKNKTDNDHAIGWNAIVEQHELEMTDEKLKINSLMAEVVRFQRNSGADPTASTYPPPEPLRATQIEVKPQPQKDQPPLQTVPKARRSSPDSGKHKATEKPSISKKLLDQAHSLAQEQSSSFDPVTAGLSYRQAQLYNDAIHDPKAKPLPATSASLHPYRNLGVRPMPVTTTSSSSTSASASSGGGVTGGPQMRKRRAMATSRNLTADNEGSSGAWATPDPLANELGESSGRLGLSSGQPSIIGSRLLSTSGPRTERWIAKPEWDFDTELHSQFRPLEPEPSRRSQPRRPHSASQPLTNSRPGHPIGFVLADAESGRVRRSVDDTNMITLPATLTVHKRQLHQVIGRQSKR